MYLNNVGLRKVASFVGAFPADVLSWIRKGQAVGRISHIYTVAVPVFGWLSRATAFMNPMMRPRRRPT